MLALLVMSTTACGGSNANAAEQSKVNCMTQVSPDQKAQFLEATNQAPVSETTREDGTLDVCVLEQQPDGTYAERHYNQNDGFSDYLLYAALFGHSNSLATFGMITGDISFGQYLALSMLSGVNNQGGLFRPYGCGLGSCPYNPGSPYTWNRDPQPLRGANNQPIRVTNIQYGNQPPRTYTGGKRPKPPAGYAKPKPIPKASDKVANATKDPSGRPTVTPVKGVSAKKVQSGKQQLPSSIKSVSPVTTLVKSRTQTNTDTKTTTKPAGNTPGTVKPSGGTTGRRR